MIFFFWTEIEEAFRGESRFPKSLHKKRHFSFNLNRSSNFRMASNFKMAPDDDELSTYEQLRLRRIDEIKRRRELAFGPDKSENVKKSKKEKNVDVIPEGFFFDFLNGVINWLIKSWLFKLAFIWLFKSL